MRDRLLRIARFSIYPLFYFFCLAMFGYFTFPYDRLKDRLISEFSQRSHMGRLEIDKVTSYWFTGVEVTGLKLVMPPADPTPGLPAGDEPPPKEAVVTIDEAHARVRLLPLLLGRVRIDFWASAFGGELSGVVPVGGAGGDVELALDKIDINKIEPLVQILGIPLRGVATGKLALSASDGKFSKASGTFDLTVADMTVGDGKAKIKGLIALPAARLGDLSISAEAKDGILKIAKLAATGADLELVGDGKVALHEPWPDSILDLLLRFKFTDAYRGKNDLTKSLLGAPGSNVPSLIEVQEPRMKRAKRPDGFYGWHIHGALSTSKLKFDPSTVDSPASSPFGRGRGKGADSPFGAPPPRKPGTVPPLGLSPAAREQGGEPTPAMPMPAPPPPAPEPVAADPPARPMARMPVPLQAPPAPPPPTTATPPTGPMPPLDPSLVQLPEQQPQQPPPQEQPLPNDLP